MKLSVKERLLISSLYPREGQLIEQLLVRDIDKKVVLEQDEMERIKLKRSPAGFNWDEKEATDLEVVFSETEISFLKQQVTRLDAEKKINQQTLELCIKIKDYKKE